MNTTINDFFKNSKSIQNLVDLNTGFFTEALNKGLNDYNEVVNAAWNYTKDFSDVKNPESFIEAQVNGTKAFGAKVQKIAEDNVNRAKSAGAKYGEAIEGFYGEVKKASK